MATLIYHNGALGDFLTTFPLLKFFRSTVTDSISLLGNPSYAQLAKAAGLIDEILDINNRSYIPLFLDERDKRTVEILKRFDRLLLFAGYDSSLVKNVSQSGNSEILVHPPFPQNRDIHIVEYHLSLLKQEISSDFDIFPAFHISSVESDYVKRLLPDNKPVALLCPGSGSRLKNWPFRNFMDLSVKLKGHGFEVIWITGPAEYYLRFPENEIVLSNQSLLTIVTLLKNCSFYIGNDSGVTHLAALSGCRTIALFGASDPRIWSPVGKEVCVIYKKPHCSPCHLKKVSQESCNMLCMKSITVEEVFGIINSQFPK